MDYITKKFKSLITLIDNLMSQFNEVLFIIFCIIMYYLPSLLGRLKKDSTRILTLNFLLGWTFIGWVVVLVWALKKDNPAANSYSESQEIEA